MTNIIGTYIQNQIAEQLVREVNNIVQDAKTNASRFSSRIPDAISIGTLDIRPGYVKTSIEIDASEDGPAPHAAAFEFGSGLHSEVYSPATYRIEPKKDNPSQMLAFFWDKTPSGPGRKFIGQAADGKLLFRFVDHPGVKAQPYLRPAIEKNRAGLVKGIARAFMEGYRKGTPDIVVIR